MDRALSFAFVLLAALLALVPVSRANAGVWEALARASDSAFFSRCDGTAQGSAAEPVATSSDSACTLYQSPAEALRQSAQLMNQETYLAALADERAATDACASTFIRRVSSGKAFESYASDLEGKITVLADLMVQIQRAMHRWSEIQSGLRAPRNRAGPAREALDEEGARMREELRRLQAALAATENSIPLSSQADLQRLVRSAMQRMIEPAITLGALSGARPAEIIPLDSARLRSELRTALERAKSSIDQDIQTLRAGARSGGQGLDRATKESLAQDRDLVESFLARNPELRRPLQNVICEVDANYGRGAEARDQALVMGSIVLTAGSMGAGLVVRSGGTVAAALMTPSRLAAARGIISVRTARVLSSAAIGLDTVAGLEHADTACLQNQRGTRVTGGDVAGDRCKDFQMESLRAESCVLGVGLTALGVTFASLGAQRVVAKLAGRAAHQQRVGRASQVLNRKLTPRQKQAVVDAHRVGEGAPGRNGKPAAIGNYTWAQLREKATTLHSAGFSPPEIRMLMENGVVGAPVENPRFLGSLRRMFGGREGSQVDTATAPPGASARSRPAAATGRENPGFYEELRRTQNIETRPKTTDSDALRDLIAKRKRDLEEAEMNFELDQLPGRERWGELGQSFGQTDDLISRTMLSSVDTVGLRRDLGILERAQRASVVQLSKPVEISHWGPQGIRRFDVNYNRDVTNSTFGTKAGAGVYTFTKSSGSTWNGAHRYDFTLPEGTTAISMHDPSIQALRDLIRRTEQMPQVYRNEINAGRVSPDSAETRWLTDRIWELTGQPDVIFGDGSRTGEIIIRNQQLMDRLHSPR